jgi:uncharacterized protein
MKQNDTQMDKLDEIVLQSILYDFYGELLSDHKKRIFEDYVLNDLSLSEIATEQGISRQGVYDIVKRCTLELKGYEAKLGLMKKFQTIKDKVARMKEILHDVSQSGEIERLDDIAIFADDILKEL